MAKSTQYLNYFYDEKTGAYLGSAVALIDQMDGTPVIMNCSTPVAPPTVTAAHKVAVFLDIDGKVPLVYTQGTWSVVDDYVGVDYWVDGEKTTITELGVVPPAGASLEEPEPIVTLEDQFAAAGFYVERLLNTLANSWDYSSYVSCRSYANDPDPQFAAEGQAMVDFSSACFVVLRNLKKTALSGGEIPTTAEGLQALLPETPERPDVDED